MCFVFLQNFVSNIFHSKKKWARCDQNVYWAACNVFVLLYNCRILLKLEFCRLTNEKPTWCHLLIYFTYYALNMFRTLIYPSSGACGCVDELPHGSSCSQFVVCWSFCCGWYLVVLVLQAEALLQPAKHNTQRTENKTTDVVIHQHSRRLLKMDIEWYLG